MLSSCSSCSSYSWFPAQWLEPSSEVKARSGVQAVDGAAGYGDIQGGCLPAAGMAINLVPVAPGVVVLPAGNPITRRALERRGVQCHAVDVDALMRGGGAVHCMTGVVHREQP